MSPRSVAGQTSSCAQLIWLLPVTPDRWHQSSRPRVCAIRRADCSVFRSRSSVSVWTTTAQTSGALCGEQPACSSWTITLIVQVATPSCPGA